MGGMMKLCFSVNPEGKAWTRAMSTLETDLFRAAVHIGRTGEGGIERVIDLANAEGWSVAKARRVLKAGERCNRFFFNMAIGRWSWTPEFATR